MSNIALRHDKIKIFPNRDCLRAQFEVFNQWQVRGRGTETIELPVQCLVYNFLLLILSPFSSFFDASLC